MIKIFFGILAVLLLPISVLAQGGAKTWDFASDTGKSPQGFTTVMGEWKVVADAADPAHPSALAQLAKNAGSTFNLILIDGTRYQNIDLSVAMKAVAGNEDQGGGLVWRAKDGKNYYVARFNPLEDNYNFYKVKDGHRSQIEGATIKSSPGWHTLRITMTAEHMEGYLDDKKVLDAKDSTFTEPGKVGLWTKSDAQSHFAKLAVSGE